VSQRTSEIRTSYASVLHSEVMQEVLVSGAAEWSVFDQGQFQISHVRSDCLN